MLACAALCAGRVVQIEIRDLALGLRGGSAPDPWGPPPPPGAPPGPPGDTTAITALPPYTKLSLETQARFLSLDQSGMVQAEYVWIGGNNELRCKTKTLMKSPKSVDDLPIWNFDGSSTEQAPGTDSEVLLKPCAMYKDPFRPGGPNLLVLCDCYKPDPDGPKGLGAAIPTNTRVKCAEIMEKVIGKEPWFGIEQEYTLFEPDRKTPYGWPKGGFPDRPQGPYYCSIGTENAYGRAVCEAHYKCCMYAGINISGINGEVMPGVVRKEILDGDSYEFPSDFFPVEPHRPMRFKDSRSDRAIRRRAQLGAQFWRAIRRAIPRPSSDAHHLSLIHI